MKELIFSLAFFFTNGNIMDTNLKLHKYDKQNFKKIYFSKNLFSIRSLCSWFFITIMLNFQLNSFCLYVKITNSRVPF